MTDAPTPPPPPAGQSPVEGPKTTFVKDGDLKILMGVGLAAMGVLIAFGVALWASGILEFPALAKSPDERDYLNDSLVYRERRMMMALVMRTFLTGFSFVVGLALCTMGGLFILRQVTSLTSLSGDLGGGGAPVAASGEGSKDVVDRLQRTQFSFASYSPGVIFMVGGVTIMVITQWFAISIKAVEVIPPGATAICIDDETGNYVTCELEEIIESSTGSDGSFDDAKLGFVGTGEGFVGTSDQVIEDASSLDGQSVFADYAYQPVDWAQQLELPEGYSVAGVSFSDVLISGPDGLLTFHVGNALSNGNELNLRLPGQEPITDAMTTFEPSP